jgi:hypothetical protein
MNITFLLFFMGSFFPMEMVSKMNIINVRKSLCLSRITRYIFNLRPANVESLKSIIDDNMDLSFTEDDINKISDLSKKIFVLSSTIEVHSTNDNSMIVSTDMDDTATRTAMKDMTTTTIATKQFPVHIDSNHCIFHMSPIIIITILINILRRYYRKE